MYRVAIVITLNEISRFFEGWRISARCLISPGVSEPHALAYVKPFEELEKVRKDIEDLRSVFERIGRRWGI